MSEPLATGTFQGPSSTEFGDPAGHVGATREALLAELMDPSTSPERLEQIAAFANATQVARETEGQPHKVWGDYSDAQLAEWLADANVPSETKDSIALYVNGRNQHHSPDR